MCGGRCRTIRRTTLDLFGSPFFFSFTTMQCKDALAFRLNSADHYLKTNLICIIYREYVHMYPLYTYSGCRSRTLHVDCRLPGFCAAYAPLRRETFRSQDFLNVQFHAILGTMNDDRGKIPTTSSASCSRVQHVEE